MSTYDFSATGVKYPLENSPVNVHGDFKKLAESLDAILPAYGVSYFQINVINTSGVSIAAGVPVYATGNSGGKVSIAKALPSTTAPILGLLKNSLSAGSEGVVVVAGVMEGINTQSFLAGQVLYVGASGGLTNSRPAGGSAAIGIVAYAAPNGIVIVEAKGNGTWGALRDGLS